MSVIVISIVIRMGNLSKVCTKYGFVPRVMRMYANLLWIYVSHPYIVHIIVLYLRLSVGIAMMSEGHYLCVRLCVRLSVAIMSQLQVSDTDECSSLRTNICSDNRISYQCIQWCINSIYTHGFVLICIRQSKFCIICLLAIYNTLPVALLDARLPILLFALYLQQISMIGVSCVY